MSDNYFTNNITVSGCNNTVNFHQEVASGNDGAEMLGMVLKFLLTLLLSPVMIPFLMAANGIKMIQGGGDNGNE